MLVQETRAQVTTSFPGQSIAVGPGTEAWLSHSGLHLWKAGKVTTCLKELMFRGNIQKVYTWHLCFVCHLPWTIQLNRPYCNNAPFVWVVSRTRETTVSRSLISLVSRGLLLCSLTTFTTITLGDLLVCAFFETQVTNAFKVWSVVDKVWWSIEQGQLEHFLDGTAKFTSSCLE